MTYKKTEILKKKSLEFCRDKVHTIIAAKSAPPACFIISSSCLLLVERRTQTYFIALI